MAHFQADIANELRYGQTQTGYQNVHCATPKPVIFAVTAKSMTIHRKIDVVNLVKKDQDKTAL